jgi:hypothetical protein
MRPQKLFSAVWLLFFAFSVLLLTSCNRPTSQVQPPAPELPTLVAATLAAMTPLPTATLEPTPAPASTATPSVGKISGKVCYHDPGVIRLNLYFQSAQAPDRPRVVTLDNPTETYSLELAPDTYTIYAWPPDYTVGALPASGPTINLLPGADVTGVDLCDFSGGPFAVPYPPGFSPSTGLGSISGRISGYSGPAATPLTVVAFNQGTGYWYYVLLMPGVLDFTISELPAGRYQVVAYDGLGAAGGTGDVYVLAGQPASAEISSWAGTFPVNPVK